MGYGQKLLQNHNFVGHSSHSVQVPNTIVTKTSRLKSQLDQLVPYDFEATA